MDILTKWLSVMADRFSPKQCVVIPVCPVRRWSQAGIVVSCDFKRMVVLQFGFRGLSAMGDSRPSLSIL